MLIFNQLKEIKMSPENNSQPMIDGVPGMPAYEGKMPSNEPIVIENPTPEMRANAMFSPDNVHPGAFRSEVTNTPAQDETAKPLGNMAVESKVQVDTDSIEPRNIPPAQTSLRTDYWKKPTTEQIDTAAKQGYDLTKQSKYF
jgi:hypothetical protein